MKYKRWTIREFNLLRKLSKEEGMSARRIAVAMELEGYDRTRHAVGRMAYYWGIKLKGTPGCFGHKNHKGKFKRPPEETQRRKREWMVAYRRRKKVS